MLTLFNTQGRELIVPAHLQAAVFTTQASDTQATDTQTVVGF